MRKLLALAVVLALPASASAAKLPYRTAHKRAVSAGAAHARQMRATGWEISPGFRFASHKLVFAWYGQLADGRGCAAQLVVRYASTRSKKVIAYFRKEECS